MLNTLPRNRWLALAALWFAAMLYSLLQQETSGQAPPFAHFDKVGHFALFFAQFWLLAKVWLSARQALPLRSLLLCALLLAAASEIAQALLTETRQGSWLDAAADIAGAAAALWLARRVQQARNKQAV